MKKLFLIMMLFLCIQIIFAEDAGVGAEVSGLSVETVINSDLSVAERITVEAFNSRSINSSYLYIFLSDIPENLQISNVNNTLLNYSSFIANGIYTIRLIDTIPSNSSKEYYLDFSNDNTVQRFDKTYVFSYVFNSYYDLNDVSFKLVIPVGFGIAVQEGNNISPPTSRLFSDGQQIIIEWIEDLNYLETRTFLVFFEKIAFSSFSIWFLLLAAVAGFIMGGGAVYFALKRKSKSIVTMALTKDEKSLVDYVLANNNSVFQNDIEKSLDFSKPKLSKIVHNLKEKNIILICPKGRKNEIEVNKEIL